MSNYFRKILWLALDLFFINIALALSLILRFGQDWQLHLYEFMELFIYFSISFIIFATLLKLYNRLWRYISISDLFLITGTVTIAIIGSLLYLNIAIKSYIPWSVKVLTWFFSLAFIGGSKLIWRLFWEKKARFKRREERILIVGAGDAGEVVCREIERRKDLGKLIGFVTNDTIKIGTVIHNRKVFGPIDKINEIIDKEKVGMVLIALASAKGSEIRKIVGQITIRSVKIKIIPRLDEFIDGKISVSQIRNIKIEDLLGREPVDLNLGEISGYLKNRRVLVTGGGGSIGGELARQICRFEPKCLILLDYSENNLFHINLELEEKWSGVGIEMEIVPVMVDIKNREKMDKIFKKYRPEVVFHAAAHKHVPMMEYYPDEAVMNNIMGTKNVAELAKRYGARKFVMISTDKAINPTSVMGASKRVAEMLVKGLGGREAKAEERMTERKNKTRFVAVRFGNVLESNGSVVPLFKRQIAEGGPVTVTDKEMKRYFMTLPEASQLVIQAGALGTGGEVFVLDMGKPIKVLDLAKQMIRLSGFEVGEDIEIKIVGLRPGEKLFEELLTEEERSGVLGYSGHENIFIAKVGEIDGEKLKKDIRELERLAKEMDTEGIVRKLQEMIASYQPNRGMLK